MPMTGPRRLLVWLVLAVDWVGVLIFGSYLAGLGGDAEGRQLSMVAPWAVPGFALAVVASVAALRTVFNAVGQRLTFVLGAGVASSICMLWVLSPSLAAPVP